MKKTIAKKSLLSISNCANISLTSQEIGRYKSIFALKNMQQNYLKNFIVKLLILVC